MLAKAVANATRSTTSSLWGLSVLVSLSLLGADLGAAAASEGELRVYQRVGRAYDLESGRTLYTETHRETFRGARLVRDEVSYVDGRGRLFARKTIDYRGSTSAPDFRYEDRRTGRLEVAKRTSRGIELQHRESRAQPLERELIPVSDVDAIDEGFHAHVRANFGRLARGGELDVSLAYPSELEEFTLRFERKRIVRREGRRLLQVSFEPASLLLRIFVPSSNLLYDLEDGRVVEYRGVSNIRDRHGDPYSVRLVYGESTPVTRPAPALAVNAR